MSRVSPSPPQALLALLCALGLGACTAPPVTDELPPADDNRSYPGREWPEPVLPELPCTPWDQGFELPEVADPSGLIRMDFEVGLQPTNQVLRVPIEIRQIGTGDLDVDYVGEVFVEATPPEGFEVIEITEPVGGIAQLSYRLSAPGPVELLATITGSGRDGTAELFGFASNLPVLDFDLSDADWDTLREDPGESIWFDAPLTMDDGTTYAAEVRLHGGSSRHYLKKSLRFDLLDGAKLPRDTDHVVLRAEWADKSMLRNYLAMEMIRAGTWLATPQVEFVHLRRNGRFYGLMLWTERIDGDFLRHHDYDNDGSLYEADPQPGHTVPGGSLQPLADHAEYPFVYQHHRGDIEYDDLIELVEGLLQSDEETLRSRLEREVSLDDYIAYIATQSVIQGQDHIRKNYYLYRDGEAEVENRWMVFPWDLDLTFGHLWSEEEDILGEDIITDADLFAGVQVPEHDFYNQLVNRTLAVPQHRATFLDNLERLSGTVFHPDFLGPLAENAVCRMTPELLSDTRKRADNDEYLGRVDEILDFVDGKREQIADAVGGR